MTPIASRMSGLAVGAAALAIAAGAALAPAMAQAPATQGAPTPPAAATTQPAPQPNPHMETIHHPDYNKNVFMPFVPAIKVKSGKMLWLAGTTALPVYHDHPHKREEVTQYMVNDLEAQTRAAMEGIKKTLEASGASFKDVVHYFVFRTRPRTGDIGKATAVINSYFAPYGHKPTSTNMAVLELGEPEQLIEIQMVAVVD